MLKYYALRISSATLELAAVLTLLAGVGSGISFGQPGCPPNCNNGIGAPCGITICPDGCGNCVRMCNTQCGCAPL